MTSKTALALSVAVMLAACVPAANAPVPDPQAYAPTDAPVPFAVSRLLPRGVTAADVRVADNCYGYAYQGAIYPVLIPRGSQYCL
ncbi:hypothetical protein MWU52_07825 [Jannaschia sp. S6380]|uniref:hypothetical protein n=1 Tax=Jannaschia sp. S6380 TaxID=2926408 RepID=UPI001FF165F5|nr:hypothetical protein [Jannaschia sp. S6380]MCK0167451.1 hypothetical protein [Jannaschia sp. S6380]